MSNPINIVIVTGIIESVSEVVSEEITMPVIRIALFNKAKKEWETGIPVVIQDDGDIRQLQGATEGDIILVEGSISIDIEDKNCIFADEIIMISKNKKKVEMPFRRISYFDSGAPFNLVLLNGVFSNVDKQKTRGTICMKREKIKRNNVASYDTVRVLISRSEEVEQGDSIVFCGKIVTNGEIVGNANVLNKGESR